MGSAQIGFAVIYRWRLHPGKEEQFRRAWKAVTLALRKERGALGSRLHRADDGTWIAYAQWPDRSTWERSRKMDPVDSSAAENMHEAIAESRPPLLLDPVSDHLA
jgi:quinol monooxygenase YgiN